MKRLPFVSALHVLSPWLVLTALPGAAVAQPGLTPLEFRVVDAEYSDTLERIVMISDFPYAVHVYDPLTATATVIDLPLPPTAVSVGPDARFAAVGHDGWVSYVDLMAGSVVKTLPVSADAFDVVLAGNGFIYVFPREDQWERIRCIEIASETETLHAGNLIYDSTRAKLHPGGTSIYGADNGLSPSDIEKYSIAGGTASMLYDSPYHGDFPMCGDLWISEEGLRIFTRCGNVFRSSELREQDMIYNGSLSAIASTVRHLDHSVEAGKILVAPDGEPASGGKVQVYDDDFLAYEGTLDIPDFVLPTGSYNAYARFVFFDGNGSQRYAIVQAEAASGLLHDYAVVTFDAQPLVPCEIELSSSVYSSGQVVTANVLRIANPTSTEAAIEWKIWLETPFGDYGILNAGANGSVVLPPGFDHDYGPLPLFTVSPGSQPGGYGVHCRMLAPVTGATTYLDENPFEIQ